MTSDETACRRTRNYPLVFAAISVLWMLAWYPVAHLVNVALLPWLTGSLIINAIGIVAWTRVRTRLSGGRAILGLTVLVIMVIALVLFGYMLSQVRM